MAKKQERRMARRTRVQWRSLFEEHAKSGLSQRAFCESRGLSLSTFNNARRRTKATALEAVGVVDADFLAVAIETEPPEHTDPSWHVELTLGAGVVLRIRSQ